MTDPSIRPATTHDRAKAAETLASAFSDDPFNRWLLPDNDRRRARLAQGMAQQFDLYLRRNGCWVTDDVGGVALWAPPHAWQLGGIEQIRMLPGLAAVMGVGSLLRVLKGFAAIEKRHPVEPHWYLALLGVSSDQQGQGTGSQLLQEVLNTCDRESLGAYLETSNKDNLPFYEAHGFTIAEEFDLVANGPQIWTMWRDPIARSGPATNAL